jgi:hypothetical protein
MKSSIFWDITLCSHFKVNRRFVERVGYSGLVELKAKQEASVKQAASRALIHACFFSGLFFDPEDGGDMFLRNVG